VAGRRARAAPVLVRPRPPIRRRPAPRHRHWCSHRHRGRGSGERRRVVRRNGADRRHDRLDPDTARVHGDARSSRLDRRAARRLRRGGRRRRDGRAQRDRRPVRAVRLCRRSPHRRRPGLRGSTRLAPGPPRGRASVPACFPACACGRCRARGTSCRSCESGAAGPDERATECAAGGPGPRSVSSQRSSHTGGKPSRARCGAAHHRGQAGRPVNRSRWPSRAVARLAPECLGTEDGGRRRGWTLAARAIHGDHGSTRPGG
jgi:hypothetical protein